MSEHTVTIRQAPWSLHHSTEGMSVMTCSCGYTTPPVSQTFIPDEIAGHLETHKAICYDDEGRLGCCCELRPMVEAREMSDQDQPSLQYAGTTGFVKGSDRVERIEIRLIKVSGRKREVLARLMAADGKWVGGPELANRRCGGSEGLRRLRELRVLGYAIEKKQLEGHNYFSYRLTSGDLVPRDNPLF